jgi:hypothetical protein
MAMLERKKGWKNARTALVLVSAGLVSSAATADPPRNCITDSYITDSKGTCVGDLIQAEPTTVNNGASVLDPQVAPIFVKHLFKNISSTPYTIGFYSQFGIVGTDLIFPTSDCSGTAYMAFFGTILASPLQAFADPNQVLWAPNINGNVNKPEELHQ